MDFPSSLLFLGWQFFFQNGGDFFISRLNYLPHFNLVITNAIWNTAGAIIQNTDFLNILKIMIVTVVSLSTVDVNVRLCFVG